MGRVAADLTISLKSVIASLGSHRGSSTQSVKIGMASRARSTRSIAEQLITCGTATHPFLVVTSKGGAAADGSAKYAAAVLTDVLSGAPGDQGELQHARRSSPDPCPGRAASRALRGRPGEHQGRGQPFG